MKQPRLGFTLLELMVVLALLIILAAVTLPSFAGLKGNADQKAAADQLRARIADARGLAMQEAAPYRLAVNKDGTRIRIGPDTADFANMQASDQATSSSKASDTAIDKATVHVIVDPGAADTQDNSDNWITIGTFLPNGTCREDSTLIEVRETNFPAIKIHLRGVTGTARVVAHDPSNNGGMKQ